MSTPDSGNILVPGLAHVYTAPYGTTLPTQSQLETDPLDLGFIEVGHTEDKGIGFNYKLDQFAASSHQALGPIIRRVIGRDVSFDVALLETLSTDAMVLGLGGGSVSRTGGIGRFTPAAAGDRVELSAVIDLVDGETVGRFIIPQVSISGDVKTTFARGALPVIPVNLAVIEGVAGQEPFTFDSNAEGMVSSAAIASIAITPLTKTLAAAATWQLTATATLTDSTTENVTVPAAWSSSDPTKATVSSVGLVTAVASGSANISCSYRGVTSTAPCVVTVS